MSKKIKMLVNQPDVTDYKKEFKKGDVIDLGFERNRSAVFNNLAEWVEEKKEVKAKKEK